MRGAVEADGAAEGSTAKRPCLARTMEGRDGPTDTATTESTKGDAGRTRTTSSAQAAMTMAAAGAAAATASDVADVHNLKRRKTGAVRAAGATDATDTPPPVHHRPSGAVDVCPIGRCTLEHATLTLFARLPVSLT